MKKKRENDSCKCTTRMTVVNSTLKVSVRETFSRYHTLEFLTPANMRLARFRQKMKLRGVVVHLAPFRAGHRIIEQVAETFFTPHPSCEVSATFRDRLINSRPMRS